MLKAIHHSLCFGIYRNTQQVGFARAITDYATFAYMADVYIAEPFRGRGLGKWLVESMLAHPELRGLRRWALLTQDAHELYRQCGFTPATHPEDVMERLQPYPGGKPEIPNPNLAPPEPSDGKRITASE
jgi:GNAT superfamily N-acetyltransferase